MIDQDMKQFGGLVDRLIAGQSLSRIEAYSAFEQILTDRATDMHQGAFLSAITAKGPKPAEIAGAWEAIQALDTTPCAPRTEKPLVDNCGTGMDSFKTFNISTAAAITAAAAGVAMARHGARAITSRCGTVDVCEALGVDVDCGADIVTRSIESAGIGLYNGMSPAVHPHALFRILSQIKFGSILNIAASLANPSNPRIGIRGVYAQDMVEPVARTMREIGFQRAIVFYGASGNGVGGIDELSPVAHSSIAELRPDGSISTFTVSPEALGIRFSDSIHAIAGAGCPETEAMRLIRILDGAENGPLTETVCLNTAPILYIADIVPDLKSGVAAARDIIASGAATTLLEKWVSAQQTDPEKGQTKFNALRSKAYAPDTFPEGLLIAHARR